MKNRHTTISMPLPIARPRNPLAVAARFRQAGLHRAGDTSRRQQDARRLQREIDDLHPPHR